MTKSRTPFAIVLGLFLLVSQLSCTNDDNSNRECQDTICTAIFVQIMVSVKDQNQNPIALDSFQVINVENGADMTITLPTPEFEGAREFGQYLLIQDGILETNETRQIRFIGFIDGQEVISSEYTVSTDCCHVGLDSGDLQLTF